MQSVVLLFYKFKSLRETKKKIYRRGYATLVAVGGPKDVPVVFKRLKLIFGELENR